MTSSVKLQINHKIASPYHPQTNGLQERFNQTFERALMKCVNEKQNDWDMHIKRILFGYRTSVHASTLVLPIYLDTGPQVKDGATTEENIRVNRESNVRKEGSRGKNGNEHCKSSK